MLYVDRASLVGSFGLCIAVTAACAHPAAPPAQTAVCPAVEKCPSGMQCTPIAAVPVPPVAAEPAHDAKPIRPRYYEMKGSLVRELHSDSTGKDYELLIGLPPSFEKEPGRRYPTLYVLDGQWDYKLLDSIAGGLRYDEVMPEMVIVGLSYGGTNPDYDALRSDDYVPTLAKDYEGNEKGGGAARFLRWLETVVIPLVEQDYRGDSAHRILSGSSFGGLFALYVLFENPDLFESYISMSPAVGWDNGYIFKREREFRKTHPRLDHRLWLSVGSREWPDFRKGALDFFKQIQKSNYASLALQVHSIEGEGHAGNKPEAYNRAMRFVSEPLMPKPAAGR